MGLVEALGDGPVAVDSVAFIYFIEQHPKYVGLLRPLFEAAEHRTIQLVTSAVTLLEVLVVPLRNANAELAKRYELLLTNGRGLHLVEIDIGQLRLAAEIRARRGVRTPDALQLAAALTMRCPTFVTNDKGLQALPGLHVLQLDTFS